MVSSTPISRIYPHKEVTRDPIFILEKRIGRQWHVESVWFTRDEAEEWAKSHEYRLKGGWRVYCLCAEGALAELLRRHTVKSDAVYQSTGEAP